jgi:hypothetical protein
MEDEVLIKPVHGSILGQDYCFEVSPRPPLPVMTVAAQGSLTAD